VGAILRRVSAGGGLFTMVYGTGWIIATGTSKVRFFVMAAALVITIVLGYLKFVRGRVGGVAAAPAAVTGVSEDVGVLAARIDALEAKLASAAEALREPGPR
jgi:hypothetical protein